jgi:hypothetical protein
LGTTAHQDINLVYFSGGGLLVKGNYLDGNSSPLSALLQADNITAIAVGTHQRRIQPANCQFHVFKMQGKVEG